MIAPQFEATLPPLQASVFPPILREPQLPALEMFSLDENFASERVPIAHLAIKGKYDDMEYMCRCRSSARMQNGAWRWQSEST